MILLFLNNVFLKNKITDTYSNPKTDMEIKVNLKSINNKMLIIEIKSIKEVNRSNIQK